MPVKPLTPEQILYQQVMGLRRQLDLILSEYEAAVPAPPVLPHSKGQPFIDPVTGKPFRKGGSSEANQKPRVLELPSRTRRLYRARQAHGGGD